MTATLQPDSGDRVDILITDDRPENLLALEAILAPLGHRLIRATSGEDALRRLLEGDVAVILLDVQMPGMNGFETARLIKGRERSRHVPIIFLTALSQDREDVFEGYTAGAVDYLVKPFQPEILRSKVGVFVDLYLMQRRLAEQDRRLRESEGKERELRHLQELLQSEERYHDVLSSAMDAIIAFDASSTVTLFNGEAERMFNCPAGEAIGAPVARLFADGVDGAAAVQHLRANAIRARNGGGSAGQPGPRRPIALTARRATGARFPIEASMSCLATSQGESCTMIVRDVSERIRQEEALREQSESLARSAVDLTALNEELSRRQVQLERAMTSRNKFYASMNHEIRTPINAMLGYSALLLELVYGPLNPKQIEGLEHSQRAARHLLEVVNDVLDLSKIEAGKIDLRLQPVTFPSVITDLFATVRPLADEHGSPLTAACDAAEITITSDPIRIRQILLNLLSNAIKFGKGLPISVECHARDDGGVTVRVVDHGEGIPAHDHERIFDEFVQVGKVPSEEGTGLGLSISRRLAELLGGSLTVESTPGTGSTFSLILPADPDATIQAIERERPTSVADERGSAHLESVRGDVALAHADERVDSGAAAD